MKRMNKKGQWQNYLLPAILAVLVLGISFYFLFNEYFTGGDVDREVCKESIMARGLLPEYKVANLNVFSLKEQFPLKCKTNVVEVTAKDIKVGKDGKRNVERIIGDTMAECWYLFGAGDYGIFPSGFASDTTSCLPCARIHLTDDAPALVKAEMGGVIDIEAVLNDVNLFDIGGKKTSYLNYLNGVGKKFYPFNPMGTGQFDLAGENFSITIDNLINFQVGSADIIQDYPDTFSTKLESHVDEWGAFGRVTLPKYFNESQGDLIIVLGQATTPEKVNNSYAPYMFYFQTGQKDYLEQLNNKTFYVWDKVIEVKFWNHYNGICKSWEGIPA